jgi:hypothetical protein
MLSAPVEVASPNQPVQEDSLSYHPRKRLSYLYGMAFIAKLVYALARRFGGLEILLRVN